MNRPTKHVHKLVHETAVAMAHELYDTMMQDDLWYRLWKKKNPEADSQELEELFVERNLAKMIPQARATLTKMMTNTSDEALKEVIYNALVLDNTLIRGRPN
jgi:hypothetical protein